MELAGISNISIIALPIGKGVRGHVESIDVGAGGARS